MRLAQPPPCLPVDALSPLHGPRRLSSCTTWSRGIQVPHSGRLLAGPAVGGRAMVPRRGSPLHQFALTLLAIAALALVAVGTAWANPAARVTREVQQPDGSNLVL